jgi:hypothetical protein
MKRFVWLLALAVCAAGFAYADPASSHTRAYPYSIYGGQTVGYGANVVHAHAGWPGISGGILHGLTDEFDIGGTATLNYGVEGATDNPQLGLKFQFNTRYRLLDTGKFDLGVHFDPGFLIYFYSVGPFSTTHAGLTIPIGISAGIPIMSALLVHVGFDVPLFFLFGDPGSFTGIPILAGGGFEYFFNRQLSINGTFRMGPTINIASVLGNTVTNTVFTLYFLGGIAYRL